MDGDDSGIVPDVSPVLHGVVEPEVSRVETDRAAHGGPDGECQGNHV